MKRFRGQIVFITGSIRGIGFSAAEEFLKEGATVYLNGRSAEGVTSARERLKEHGDRVQGFAGSMADEARVQEVVENIASTHGKIDVLVNAAGVSQERKFHEITMEDWYSVFDNNVTNTFLTSKYVAQQMITKGHGKIINVSSVAGRSRSKLAGLHYSSAKAAVITMTRQLGAELAPYGINVNCICPGQTNTEMLAPFLTEENKQKLGRMIPMGRVAEPEEQSRVILFLASEDARYMTGSILDINGGQL